MQEWLVVVPDFDGVHKKRLEVRPQHFAGVKQLVDEKKVTWGGAMLHDAPEDDNDPTSWNFAGSAMTVLAETKEEAREIVRNDPYTKNGVWNAENAQIFAFKPAVRVPLKKD